MNDYFIHPTSIVFSKAYIQHPDMPPPTAQASTPQPSIPNSPYDTPQ